MPDFSRAYEKLSSLPISLFLAEICSSLKASESRFLVLTAETAAGKSTAVPIALLEHFAGKILMLEPRRLAASAIAERLSDLLGEETGETVGLYILHPNNVGRCGHICNASYAVRSDLRGHHIGGFLVKDCIKKAKDLGYGVLQFNAVVATNEPALKLYKKLGFTQLGVIPKGFRMIDGHFEDIIPHYIEL